MSEREQEIVFVVFLFHCGLFLFLLSEYHVCSWGQDTKESFIASAAFKVEVESDFCKNSIFARAVARLWEKKKEIDRA